MSDYLRRVVCLMQGHNLIGVPVPPGWSRQTCRTCWRPVEAARNDRTNPTEETMTDPEPPTLADFVLARLAEDEQVARAAMAAVAHAEDRDGSTRWCGTDDGVYAGANGAELIGPYGYADEGLTAHIARHDPARVLADVAAKRAIVALYQHKGESMALYPNAGNAAGFMALTGAIRALAQPFTDHPQYSAEWGP